MNPFNLVRQWFRTKRHIKKCKELSAKYGIGVLDVDLSKNLTEHYYSDFKVLDEKSKWHFIDDAIRLSKTEKRDLLMVIEQQWKERTKPCAV